MSISGESISRLHFYTSWLVGLELDTIGIQAESQYS